MRIDYAPRQAGTLMTSKQALATLDGMQAGLRSALQDPDSPHAEMLTSLMISNSLLELSKLASARLGLGEFAQAALLTINQCTPIESCILVLNPPGLPVVRATLGMWPDDETTQIQASMPCSVAALYGSDPDNEIGYLGITGAPQTLLAAGLLERTTDHLTSMLSMLIDAEHMRRAAAASRAMELVGGLDDNYEEADLFDIVATIATLPGIVAANLLLEIPRFGGPITVEAGVVPEKRDPEVCETSIDRTGKMTLTVWWDVDANVEEARLPDIFERLRVSIARAEQTARLRAEVETDELTGTGNRRRASRALAQASARARRTGEEYSIFLMDLDRFKAVNDDYGHEIGDEVLRAFSRAMENVIRGYDVAARWGGEEFLIVCPSTGTVGAEAIAGRLLVETTLSCADVLPPDREQTVSIGIAVCQNPEVDPIELIRIADAAMYQAKTTGRNRFVLAEASKKHKGR